jgi:hypothetical protein
MAIVQSTYSFNQPVADHGMPATMHGWDADTKLVETAAGIGFGLVVSAGTDKGKQIVVGGSAVVGVTLRDITVVAADATKYPRYANASVLTRGDIWLQVPAAVAVGDPVSYTPATGVISNDTVDTAHLAVPRARWMRGAAQNGFAILRLGDDLIDT